MDNEKDTLDFNLDDIARQLQDIAKDDAASESTDEIAAILSNLDTDPLPESEALDGSIDPEALEQAQQAFSEAAQELLHDPAPAAPEEAASEAEEPQPEASAAEAAHEEEPDTVRLDELAFSGAEAPGDKEPTTRVEEAPQKEEAAEAPPQEVPAGSRAIPLFRSAQLRELKRKLVAGPEKRYYSLSEVGVGKLQLGIVLNLVILGLCGIAIILFSRGLVPQNRMKLMVFSQIFAMLVSGLLGCNLMLDGLGDLLHLRYSLNTTLAISFLACCADAWFCLKELRVPFCAAFVLEMTMAMLARYHKRTTELAQLDTMRKASSLTSIVKEPKFYENRPGILRGQGDVDDFMETYTRTSGPEVIQQVYAFVALIACIGISVLTGLLHGASMAVKIFSTSLMVSVPAGYFVALTRPAALLEKRLHMVGTVICGWQGVKKLCGKAVVPLRDKDLFPRGSTKLNGIKFYSERSAAEVVSYTASLIFAAGGGLVPLFRNLLASRNGTEYPVENFRDYGQGGIGGEINGEPVLLGSLEFLQDMGVDIPAGTMVNQAVYVSIDGQLSAVIAISYAKMRSAAAGIVSLCGCRKLRTLLLAGDFMMTDSFIRSKFSIRTRRLILPPKEVRAELLARQADPEADVLALVTRDDLLSTAYAITGSMALRTSCRLGSIVNILGGITGIVIMLALSYLGSTELLTPARVLCYQLVWMIPSLLATEWTRVV